jgi:hypothetical protein
LLLSNIYVITPTFALSTGKYAVAKIIVHTPFDYRFPSGSLVAFKASDDPVTTKREIVDYALTKGYGIDPEAKADPEK